ncbi:phage tail sheath family protein [Dactylosporangium roseum]|uniref:Phage tail sheath family protein n=1 Tax=Dactylosporangium roseum TaxID=47989 RepID=A0ABY5ZAV0_9ACTN|nr:phage tail sheath subtilisin-like domain-containing protein [Dactylosporangium roseum]UWZ39146.1 phage tail sheath family protein [Dactylosporangium roseum]
MYVQEVPSGARTIVGVSTSVTAFVGATRQGPVNQPTKVRSMAEYVRTFGPLWDAAHPVGHAVNLFFANGGVEAIVVRATGAGAAEATATLRNATPADVLVLSANGSGAWANRIGSVGLEAAVDHAGTANPADLFTLVLRQRAADSGPGGSVVTAEETFANLSMAPKHPRYVGKVLPASKLARLTGPATPVAGTSQATSTGKNALPAQVSLGADNGVLRVAVDHGPVTDLTIASGAAADVSRNAVVTAINTAASAAALPVTASLNGSNVLVLTTTGTAGANRSVVVHTAPSGDASATLTLGLAAGGTEVSGAAGLRPVPTAAGAERGFGGGTDADPVAADLVPAGGTGGIYALGALDLPRFNLLCLPSLPATDPGDASTAANSAALSTALAYCQRERAFLIVDTTDTWPVANANVGPLAALGEHGAIYYPRVTIVEQPPGGLPVTVSLPASGAVAGVLARTDAARGVWKAPAGLDAGIAGIAGLSKPTDDGLSGDLNPRGVNVLRTFPGAGSVVWGARTLKGADSQASEHKYIPVRRVTDYIAGSLYLGTQFAVFEPNDPDLWAQLRLAVGTFMRGLFRAGAFQQSPLKSEADSFFVVCDETVNPQSEIDLGRVNVVVGFAPLKPAEFVVITITQISKLEG